MSAAFLEEQLKRIREMTDHISKVHDQAAEVSDYIARGRELHRIGPLQDVRDLRTYSSPSQRAGDRPGDHGARGHRHASRNPTRRRR